MSAFTILFPDEISEQVSRLPNPHEFVSRAVADALRHPTSESTGGGVSRWAQVVTRIESQPGLGEYAKDFERSRKEFRTSFRLKHDGRVLGASRPGPLPFYRG